MSDFSNCPACADGKLQWTYVTLGAETLRVHGCNKCNYEFWEPKITVSQLGIPSIYTPLQITPSVFSESKNEMSNEELLDLLIRAANDNNEFDNRSDLEYYRLQALSRMKKLEEENKKMHSFLQEVIKLEDRWKFEIVFRIKEYLKDK